VLQLDDPLRRRTLGSLRDFELDLVALGQGLEALRLNGGMMHEAVLRSILWSNKAKAWTRANDGVASRVTWEAVVG
jgi:hypothetical protein